MRRIWINLVALDGTPIASQAISVEAFLAELAEVAAESLGCQSCGLAVGTRRLDLDTTITEAGLVDHADVTVIPAGGTVHVFASHLAFCALRADGSVVCWGDPGAGGSDGDTSEQLARGVVTVCEAKSGFAAVKANGSVVCWGSHSGCIYGAAATLPKIAATEGAFAVQTFTGAVQAWGDRRAGGHCVTTFHAAPSQQQPAAPATSARATTVGTGVLGGTGGITTLLATKGAFAALRGEDGAVIAWGDKNAGGSIAGIEVLLHSGVEQIVATQTAFAALKGSGRLVTWGMMNEAAPPIAVQLPGQFKQIVSQRSLFVATRLDGTAATWGSCICHGGRRHDGQPSENCRWCSDRSGLEAQLAGGLQRLVSTRRAFVALRMDGSVVAWGNAECGGDLPAAASATIAHAGGVEAIEATDWAFAAVCRDTGEVVAWGQQQYGGDASLVTAELHRDVKAVAANAVAFAALRKNGAVVAWGHPGNGGKIELAGAEVMEQLQSGVVRILHTRTAFAALKADGSVVVWGNRQHGGWNPHAVERVFSPTVCWRKLAVALRSVFSFVAAGRLRRRRLEMQHGTTWKSLGLGAELLLPQLMAHDGHHPTHDIADRIRHRLTTVTLHSRGKPRDRPPQLPELPSTVAGPCLPVTRHRPAQAQRSPRPKAEVVAPLPPPWPSGPDAEHSPWLARWQRQLEAITANYEPSTTRRPRRRLLC